MLCQRHITPPHCLSKETTLNPRVLLWPAPSPRGSIFSGISSCGTLRFAPWALTRSGLRPGLVAFLLVVASPVGFWPCGPSFPCILALWAVISLYFGLVGLHFLAFWLFRGRLLGPPHKLPQMARLPNILTMDLSAPWPAPFCSF